MSEYTPSTEQDTAHYREAVSILASGLVSEVEKRRFDAWLASVKADAWDEGYYFEFERAEADRPLANPYRGVNDE